MKIQAYISQLILRFLLSVYVLGVFSFSLPIVNDFVQHTFNEIDHIGTVHFEKGKYHVHQEVEKLEKNTSKNQAKVNSIKEIDFHFTQQNDFSNEEKTIVFCNQKEVFSFSKTILLIECEAPEPPPKNWM